MDIRLKFRCKNRRNPHETVKFHRAMVMKKMKARSVAELTILADRAGVAPMRKAGSKYG